MPKIDTHHHILPECYKNNLEKVGMSTNYALGGLPLPRWSPEEMIALMDQNDIEGAITSISDPGIHFKDEQFTASLARECNEFSAELIEKYPGRIGALGSLPLPYIDASLAEIEHCFDTLNLDGIILFSNYSSGYLGNDIYHPVFEELNRRRATVFIHPTTPLVYNAEYAVMQPAMLEFVFDTTRSIVSLLMSGIISKCTDIKFLIAHAGGALPYLATRLSYLEDLVKSRPDKMAPGGFANIPEGVMNALKGLYYDTTLSAKSATLKCLLDFVPSENITFGCDFPFLSDTVVSEEVKDFNEFFQYDQKAKTQIEYKTAQMLFPRFS